MKLTKAIILSLMLGLSAVLGACGGGETETETETEGSPAMESPAMESPAMESPAESP